MKHSIAFNYCTATVASLALSATTLVAGLAIVPVAPASATNLINNGSFSSGNLDNWNAFNTTIDLSTTPISALLGSSYSSLNQAFSTTPDISTQYRASFDILNPQSDSFNYLYINVANAFGDIPTYGYLDDLIAAGQVNITVSGSGSNVVNTIDFLFNSTGLPSGFFGTDGFGQNTANDYFYIYNYGGISSINITNIAVNAVVTASVPEPFTVIGTLVGGTAVLRMRKKLKSAHK
jgi:hypothetical protein